MIKKANFASMTVEELWEIYEEISKLLEAKMLAEKEMLERRLTSLHPASMDRPRARRHYAQVVPKFANPDDPNQVWSGRGKRPRWVTQKLASGLSLEDLSIGRGSSVATADEDFIVERAEQPRGAGRKAHSH
jgi:DNA-binding protein H-NS